MNQILYNLRLTYKTIKSRNHNPPPRNEAISSRSLGSAPSIVSIRSSLFHYSYKITIYFNDATTTKYKSYNNRQRIQITNYLITTKLLSTFYRRSSLKT